MRSLVLPSGAATLIRRSKPVHLSLDAVVQRIPVESKTDMDEQIYNCKLHVDGDLGVALVHFDGSFLRTWLAPPRSSHDFLS